MVKIAEKAEKEVTLSRGDHKSDLSGSLPVKDHGTPDLFRDRELFLQVSRTANRYTAEKLSNVAKELASSRIAQLIAKEGPSQNGSLILSAAA